MNHQHIMKNSIPFGLLPAAIIAFASLNGRAAIPWSDEFTVGGATPPPFEAATVFANVSATGYGLVGSSPTNHPGGDYNITSFARFDDLGTLRWALYLDGGPDSREVELIGDFDNTNRAFAGYVEESLDVARFGLFTGTNGAAVYARELTLTATPDQTSLRFFPNSIAAVVQESGTNMRVLTVGPTGSSLFEKDYGSAVFGVSPGLFSFVQDQTLTQLPDRTGYILSVRMSAGNIELVPPFTSYNSNRVVTVCLNTNGSVRWSKLFSFATGVFPTRDLNLAADGSAVYSFLDTLAARTHLLKLNPVDGSLAWARTLQNARLPVINFGPSSTVLLSGSRPASTNLGSFETDFLLARLNFSSGALEAQAALRGGPINGGSVAGATADRVYWVMQSGDTNQFNVQTSYVGHVTLNLTTPTAKKYNSTVSFAAAAYRPSDQSVLYSPFEIATGAVGAISLDQNLVPASDCGLFGSATVQLDNTTLTNSAWAITVTDTPLTTNNVASTIVASGFTPALLTLNEQALCTGPAAPTLTIVRTPPTQATISWTPATPGFVLQEKTNLTSGNWSNSPSGSTNPITVPATLPAKFYRLSN
jgi:hypothetical protein